MTADGKGNTSLCLHAPDTRITHTHTGVATRGEGVTASTIDLNKHSYVIIFTCSHESCYLCQQNRQLESDTHTHLVSNVFLSLNFWNISLMNDE